MRETLYFVNIDTSEQYKGKNRWLEGCVAVLCFCFQETQK